MSRHYMQMTISPFSLGKDTLDELFKQLDDLDPAVARKMRAVDWKQLRRDLMSKAIRVAAGKLRAAISGRYNNTTMYGTESGAPPTGECLGVITDGRGVSLGVSVQEDGSFSLYHNRYSEEVGRATVATWKAEIEREYKKLSVEAALAVIGSESTRSEEEGATVFIGKVGVGKDGK